MTQLEGLTTKKYTNMYWGDLGREKTEEKKKRLATVASSGSNLKKTKGRRKRTLFKRIILIGRKAINALEGGGLVIGSTR